MGEIIVNDMSKEWKIEPARSQISGNQDFEYLRTKEIEILSAHLEWNIPMKCCALYRVFF